MNDENVRDFVDRALREQLQDPEILGEFLRHVAADLADGLLFEQMRPAPQEFLVGNFRQREPDIMLEIPYRADQETSAFVCVMVEHQTRSERQIPIKLHTYSALYWEWQWRAWEAQKTPKSTFLLTPIFPVVLHTGPRPWGSARSLRELFAPPTVFHQFVPNVEPIFWDLANQTATRLLQESSPFLQMLTILKADSSTYSEAAAVFAAVFHRLDELHDTRSNRWAQAVKFLLGWTHHKRPLEERQQWHDYACQLQADAERRREIETMGQTIAQAIHQEGRQEGRQEGLTEGQLQQAKKMLLLLGENRLGVPDTMAQSTINDVTDIKRLDRWILHVGNVTTWTELLAIK